ncbi:amidase [Kribbella sp. NPDC056861]|uniref:amidase n=1 Tax=Kribbella sp. NPDC056861 TaxID=3154857 RepID=UPI00342DA471
MTELHELSATEQLDALHNKAISSRELTAHYLERIERLDGELGAFTTVDPEAALEQAGRVDDRLVSGPLAGLPLGIKDLYATAGLRTTYGSAALQDFVPTEDTRTVGLLRQAGAVIVGKTSTSELGATCYTEHDGRAAVTPYDTTRYSSGSSGGAATAVSAGLLPLAHGSDSAGSIRTPAAACHLVGIKPSRGLVSAAPAVSFFSAGTEGPIARTVADAALLLEVMAQPWAGDLYGWRLPADKPRSTRALKVAMWTDTGLDDVDQHPEGLAAVRRTADLLRELGHHVQEIAIPARLDDPTQQAVKTWFAAAVGFAVPALVPAERRHLLKPYTRHLLESTLSANDVMTSQAVLARYASTFLATLDEYDVALTPTTNGPPVPIGHFFANGTEGESDLMLAWSCHTPWANLTGQPAISLPSHLDPDGLPHSIQLVGRPRHDAELIALAAQLETP